MQGLNPHQIELLKKASVTPDQIFSNLDGLNEEIAETYDQQSAVEAALADSTLDYKNTKLEPVQTQFTVKQLESTQDNGMDFVDNDAALQAEAKAAEAALQMLSEQKKEEQQTESVEEELSPQEQQRNAILELLARVPGAPNAASIAQLKAQYGDNGVHVLALGEDDVYIFTYLRRGQWAQIQKVVQAAAASDVGQNPDELLKEKVIQYTVKWPKQISSPEFLYNSRAGVIDTLYQTILLNSYFLSPQQAMMLTTQL